MNRLHTKKKNYRKPIINAVKHHGEIQTGTSSGLGRGGSTIFKSKLVYKFIN